MTTREYLSALRRRWKVIVVTTVVGLLLALGYSAISVPTYTATTRLFVSTRTANVVEAYQGSLASQQRVASYASLVPGPRVAKGALEELHINMTPQQLIGKLKVSTAPESVLLDISVDDGDPRRASDLANAVADQLVLLVAELEAPPDGGPPASRITVVDQATPPSTPTSPRAKLNVAIGIVAGLLLGIALAVIRERSDNSVKDSQTLESLTGVPNIGTVPADKNMSKNRLIKFDTDSTPAAESFRELRTKLHFLQVDNPPRAIVVTSAVPLEGKSQTAINLALAMAAGGESVVLVDCDLRRPVLSERLGLLGSVGISTVLSGRIDLDDALQPTEAHNVTLLAAGELPPNPAALLGSDKAQSIIAALSTRFDFIICDSAPLLPVIDAAELTINTDGALMVVKHGHTKKSDVTRALRKLTSINANVLGTIVTMAPGGSAESYGYDYSANTPADTTLDPPPPHGVAERYGATPDSGPTTGRHIRH